MVLYSDDPNCLKCSETEESVERILFECPLYRMTRLREIYEIEYRENLAKLIENEKFFKKFQNFATEAFKIRKNI